MSLVLDTNKKSWNYQVPLAGVHFRGFPLCYKIKENRDLLTESPGNEWGKKVLKLIQK